MRGRLLTASPAPSVLVIMGGVSAAMHVGKLPPALPALADALGLTLLQAGFMLSLVQLAGMSLGLVIGLAADTLGLKRTMVTGLSILSAAGIAGGFAQDVPSLLALRAAEGLGFLLASMPAPALIRRLVAPQRLSRQLGVWGAYMPLGTALALLAGPVVIQHAGWSSWWWAISTVSLAMVFWIGRGVPARPPQADPLRLRGWGGPIIRTLSAPGPWAVSLCFAMYSGQWLALIGFLPSVYAQAGFAGATAGLATAAAAAVNIAGNVAAGRLLQRGAAAHRLLYIGFAAMGVGALVAFAPMPTFVSPPASVALKYVAVLVFSAFGGLIPGTLFTLAVRLAPDERTVSSTVGWMQQWSSAGQFAGPPLVAWVAVVSGGWQWSWIVTGGCAMLGLLLARSVGRLLRPPAPGGAAPGASPKI